MAELSDIGFEDEEEESGPSDEEIAKYEELTDEISERADAAKVEFTQEDISFGDFDPTYSIHLPENRGKRSVTIWDIEDAETLISIGFEKIKFIEDYQSYCSYEDGYISAAISPLIPISSRTVRNRSRDLLRRILDCQRRSKSTPLAGVKMHHLMRFSPALAVVPVVHRRDPRCFV